MLKRKTGGGLFYSLYLKKICPPKSKTFLFFPIQQKKTRGKNYIQKGGRGKDF